MGLFPKRKLSDDPVTVITHNDCSSEDDEEEGHDDIEVQESSLDDSPHRSSATTAGALATVYEEQQQDRGIDARQSFDPKADLHPPMSYGESFRDWILSTLDRPIFQVMGIIVLFLVIADGAVFFFFLMGWQTLCDTPSKMDCEPRNQIYNISIQLLTGLFSYMAVVSLPWRLANWCHTVGWHWPRRENKIGYDIYGVPSHDVWYHIPRSHRTGILFFLLLNCITQYLNQASRVVFYSYELQNVSPGNIWTNVFFGASMVCAFIGGVWMGIISEQIRKQDPDRFGPGPIQVLEAWWERKTGRPCCWPCKKKKHEQEDDEEPDLEGQPTAEDEDDEDSMRPLPPSQAGASTATSSFTSGDLRSQWSMTYTHDPTREPDERSVLGGSRSELRMFGM